MSETRPLGLSLVQRAGPALELEAVYQAHASAVFTLARRLIGSDAEAADVLQETFLEVARSLHRYRGDGALWSWLSRIAATKALMRLRSSGRLADDGALPELGEAAPQVARLELAQALDQLGSMSRAVVWLHDVEGHTHEEIAARLHRTASFSKSQLARAHARLRTLLEGSP